MLLNQNNILQNQYFWFGLILKWIVFTLFSQEIAINQYLPFLMNASINIGEDPWKSWVLLGNNPEVFPYGQMIVYLFTTIIQLGGFLGISSIFAYIFVLFIFDFLLLFNLLKLFKTNKKLIFKYYWLSPIVIIPVYIYGFNDIIVTCFLALCFIAIYNNNLISAALFFVLALASKLTLLVVLPFLPVYLYRKFGRNSLIAFGVSMIVFSGIFLGPSFIFYNLSDALVASPLINDLLSMKIEIQINLYIYINLFVLGTFFYSIWHLRYMSFSLFFSLVGLLLLIFVLINPASPGWLIWLVPFLIWAQGSVDHLDRIQIFAYQNILLLGFLFAEFGTIYMKYFSVDFPFIFFNSFVYTGSFIIGTFLTLKIYKNLIAADPTFYLSKSPICIGIAGDSGVWKDTIANSLIDVFGKHSSVKLSGDDYHLWNRRKPIWNGMTHLNPAANDIECFTNDVRQLAVRNSILNRHYDHESGALSSKRNVRPNNFLMVVGLHTLITKRLREKYDLSVYIEMDESLRRAIKIIRDTSSRNQKLQEIIESMERRQNDFERFIKPQKNSADLCINISLVNNDQIEEQLSKGNLRCKIESSSKLGIDIANLTRILVGVCGLNVVTSRPIDSDREIIKIEVEGEMTQEDTQFALQLVCKSTLELVAHNVIWASGALGIIQVIILAYLETGLERRL